MSAGSDFSLEVGVRVKDDASPAFQRIGRSAVESGRAVQSAGSSFGRFGDQASQGMRRSSQAIDGASRSWRTQMQRAGIEAGTAGGEGISRGVSSSARASSAGVQSAARTWRTEVSQAGESAGAAGGAGIARGVGGGAASAVASVQSASQQWDAAAAAGGGAAGETGGSALAERFKEKLDGLGEGLSEKLGKLGAVVAGASVGDWLLDAIGKASDLNETVSKSQAIFEGQANSVRQWSQGAAQSMGLSSQAALDAATSFGDMFRQLGDSGPAAAQTSQQVVQLAADLGSFNNLETGDVIDRLSASFRGEFDSLQAIIPNINAARVEQEAMAETGKDSASALTQQEKAHATLAIVLKDSSRAQGDFAKTASGAANTAKRNAAAMDDLKAKVGSGLLSAYQALQGAMSGVIAGASALADVIGKIAGAFSSLPGPVQMMIGTFAAMRLAQVLLGNQITATGARLAALGGAFRTFSAQQTAASVASANLASNMTRSASGVGAMVRVAGGGAVQMGRFGTSIQQIGQHVPAIDRAQGAFVNAAAGADRFGRSAGVAAAGGSLLKSAGSGLLGVMGGPLGLAFAGASIAAGVWAKHQQDSAQKVAEHKQAVAQLTGTLDQSTGAFTAATRAQAAKDLSDKGLLESSKRYGLALSDVTDAYLGQPGAIEKVNAALDSQNERYKSANSYYNEHGRLVEVNDKKNRSFKESLNEVAGSGKDAQRALQLQNEAMKQTSSAATPAKTAVQQLAEAQKKSEGASKAMVDALQKVNNAFLELRGGERGYEAAIDDATKALKENGLTLDIHTEKGRANGEALDKVAASAQTMMSDMAKNGASAGQVASQYASSRAELVKMAESFGMTAAEAGKYADKALQIPKEVKTKVDLEADAAKKAFASLKDDAVKLDGSKVVVEAKALNDKNVKAALEAIPGVQHDKQGNLIVDTKALNAEQTRLALKGVENVAVAANGKIVHIPAGTNAPAIKALIEGLGAKSVAVNGTKVQINTSAPLANADREKINKLKGAAVNANGTMVTIDSKAITADTLAKINGVLNAAQSKTFSITAVFKAEGDAIARQKYGEYRAKGGRVGGSDGLRRFASGGSLVPWLPDDGREYGFQDGTAGGRIKGPGSATSDQVLTLTTTGPVLMGNSEHVITGREVDAMGGHDNLYRMRAYARTGKPFPRFASGGSVDDDWTPDMSGIMAYAASLKVDPSALTDQRKKVADQNTALNKAIRDLRAAQAGVRGKSGAARVKAENAVATAIERQAKAQRDLNDGKAKLSQMSAGARADTTTRFMMGTTSQNGISQRFLDNIERIRKRGFPRLARSLLEQGDSDAQAIAQTLSGGALSRLKSAQAGLDTSDKLADRKTRLLDDLKGISTGEVADQARAQANAQLIAMQAANQRIAWASGPTTARLEARLDVLADAIRSQPAPIVQPSPVKVITQLDSRPIAESTFGHGAREAQWGSVLPGAEGGW